MNLAVPQKRQRFDRAGLALVSLGLALSMAPVAASADAGQIAATVCAACHGADGNSVAPSFPKLAGQSVSYLTRQLKDFQAGKRKNEIMAPNAANLSPEDIKALAQFFHDQKPAQGKPGDAALSKAGEKLYSDGNPDAGVPACAGCHQDGGVGDSRYPRLAGQSEEYLLAQLHAFKSGERTNDRLKVMPSVAGRMTDDEMKAVSAYLSGL